jgi:hypothetical protein
MTQVLDREWEPTGWWKVVAPDGSTWCETSDEAEARASMRPGDRLRRLWSATVEEWREADG